MSIRKIHLHWMRDSAQGGFSYPFVTTIARGQSLGSAVEMLLGRKLKGETIGHLSEIESQLPLHQCELHLPFVERKELEDVDQLLTETLLEKDTPQVFRLRRHTINFEQEFFRQCLTLMAPAFFPISQKIPSSVSFTHSTEAAAGAYLPWFPQVGEGKDGRICTPMTVSVTLTQSGESSWESTYPERNRHFLPVYARVSVAMRKAMRFWVPFLFFTERNRYMDSSLVWPLLAWSATTSPQAKNIREFSYDVLDADSMEKAFRSFRRNMRGYLETIAPALQAMDMPDLARRYSPGKAYEGATHAIYNRKNLDSLFVGEADLFDVVQRICLELAALRKETELTEARRLRRFHKLVRTFSRDFLFHLSHFYASRNWECLATMLLLEITNALSNEPQPLAMLVNGQSVTVAQHKIVDGQELLAA